MPGTSPAPFARLRLHPGLLLFTQPNACPPGELEKHRVISLSYPICRWCASRSMNCPAASNFCVSGIVYGSVFRRRRHRKIFGKRVIRSRLAVIGIRGLPDVRGDPHRPSPSIIGLCGPSTPVPSAPSLCPSTAMAPRCPLTTSSAWLTCLERLECRSRLRCS